MFLGFIRSSFFVFVSGTFILSPVISGIDRIYQVPRKKGVGKTRQVDKKENPQGKTSERTCEAIKKAQSVSVSRFAGQRLGVVIVGMENDHFLP